MFKACALKVVEKISLDFAVSTFQGAIDRGAILLGATFQVAIQSGDNIPIHLVPYMMIAYTIRGTILSLTENEAPSSGSR